MASSLFLGLDASEWTAVGTIVLALATAVLVLLTRGMARAAERSAADSAAAASHAGRAAQAANDLLLANLPVDFSITYTLYRSLLVAQITVMCEASTVYFRELRLVSGAGPPARGSDPLLRSRPPTSEERKAIAAGIAPTKVCPPVPSDFPLITPHLMHRGESVNLAYPAQELEPGPFTYIRVRVVYSLTETGEPRSIDRNVDAWAEIPPPHPPGASGI